MAAGRAAIDFDQLESFVDGVRKDLAWVATFTCGVPIATAVAPASSAVDWTDESLQRFAFRWDLELNAIAEAARTLLAGVLAAGAAYASTDENLAQDDG